jgi:serine/threonine-protein kinase
MGSMQPVKYEPGEIVPGSVYRVVRHLASGGMGTVYEVEDTSVEKRYVLKTLHPQLVAREELARRMRDEAKSLARLQHPNIVDVITAGVTADKTRLPYYVMERLVGQNLRVVLKKKRVLEPGPALRIAIDVLDALEHAHENQIVHRDVKPENIFLHRNANGTTTTKLLDFGIVRLLDRDGGQTTGKFIGTLRYASPEQITGRAIGPATDVYSLALVLYELLVGRGPFDDVGDGYAIGTAHAGRPPPPPSAFAPIDPEIERLVMSALAKDPAARPRDCFTFATELRRSLQLEHADARSSTPTEANLVSPESNGQAPTEAGMPPPTPPLASAWNDTGPVSPVAPTVAAQVEPGVLPRQREIDREAPTRTSAALGGTQRIPSNDTRMEENAAGPPRADERLLRPSDPGEGSWPSPTGPIAGEAATRSPAPPPRIAAVVAASVLVLAAGAALAVRYRPAVAVAGAPAPVAISAARPEPTPSASETPEATTEAPVASATSAAAAPRPSPAAAVRPTSSKPVATGTAVPARRGAPSARAPEIKFDP